MKLCWVPFPVMLIFVLSESASGQLRSVLDLPLSPLFDGACAAVDGREPASVDLYPIGFSRDGLFAYLEAEFGMIGYTESVVVRSLVTDGEVDRAETYRDEEGTITHPSDEQDIQSLFERHGIVTVPDLRLTPFPLRQQGEVFTAQLDTVQASAEARSYDVILTSDVRGRKTVSSVSARDSYGRGRVDRFVRGYYMSPFEDRVVIVVSGLASGFEAEPECDVALIGAHLRVGFSEP